ncbi:mitochondrial import inner membrane translocase subunit Tim21 isoform X2 [Sapajus apella]|uniref:Mitochondrial import inner membrane translocase subunit Tim21 n=1 Tax=Sapajus apella TaxID=9515 RepID=A0A6J3J4Z8_SAPAP|nr:mitochondrial import inner membrane translocase subunit Tim21 isoform X2 [Sapajus apella]
MICTFLRAIQYTEKLHKSSAKRLLLPHVVLNKACLKTEPSLRWGLQYQKKTVRPRCIPGVTQKAIWTQGPSSRKAKEDSSKQVSVHRSQRGGTAVSTAQKVKETGRDFSYLVVVLFGITITGGLFYTIFKELFSSSSPSKIYGRALDKCRSHPESHKNHLCSVLLDLQFAEGETNFTRIMELVIGVFGEPIKGYGEATKRGRRQHISFIDYVKDGLEHTRVKFYIEGSEPGKQGTVHAEVKKVWESWVMGSEVLSAVLLKF